MYGKIFEEIFDGSLMVRGGTMATYVFMSMIVLADEHGVVKYSPDALGKRIGLPQGSGCFLQWEDFRNSIEILEDVDPESNLSDENGRRIIPMAEITNGEESRGWWIVNYDFYRKKASKFDQKDKTKERVRKFRERNKKDVTPCNDVVTHGNDFKGHTDTDTDTDTDKEKIYKKEKVEKATQFPPDFKFTPELKTYAIQKGIPEQNVRDCFEHFENHHRAKGTVMKDWARAWYTWVQKARTFDPTPKKDSAGSSSPTADRKFNEFMRVMKL